MGDRDRGEFALSPGRGPVVTRKVHGQIMEIPIRSIAPEQEVDMLLDGIPASGNVGGGLSRFGSWSRETHGSAGAGTFDGDQYQRRSDGNYDVRSHDRPTSMPNGEVLGEDPDLDILMQEYGERPREEGEFLQDENRPSLRDTPYHTADDIEDRELDEAHSRDREKGQGGTVFATVADEVDNLFD